MTKDLQLIKIFCAVCHHYNTYNNRICYLAEAFKVLSSILLCEIGIDESHADFVMDSIPIILAGPRRSGKAKVAADICSKGYCASKQLWYYGMKLHILAQYALMSMPNPAAMMLSKANTHDLEIGKQLLSDLRNLKVYCDTAYTDKAWQAYMLAEHGVEIITPIKLKNGQQWLDAADKLFSRAVSSVKQVIESFNNWLIEKTNIQRASKVRSSAGLTAFVFARIACACFGLNS